MNRTSTVGAGDTGWTGSWVAQQAGVRLADRSSPLGLTVADLVGLALRRNWRRPQLLVSTVLGKHVPTDPRIVYAAGLLLGGQVAYALTDTKPADLASGRLLREALAGQPGNARALLDHAPAPAPALVGKVAVLGYAETATALGHAVADALPGAVYLHSTRRPVGTATEAGFEEEHSHASSHLLLAEDPQLLTGDVLVLVDDELSTGRTVLNTVATVHRRHLRRRYVVAALVDVRSEGDRVGMALRAAELGVRLDVVALASGTLTLPPDLPAQAARLLSAHPDVALPTPASTDGQIDRIVPTDWPTAVREGGRHGFTSADRRLLKGALREVAVTIAATLTGRRVLVLGFEELMYAPLLLAGMLLDLAVTPALISFSTTTRSPVLAVDEPGYPIRSRLVFPAHDEPADGPGERYAYNVTPGAFDHVVVVVDAPADTPQLHADDGLLAALRALEVAVTLVVLPAYTPKW